MQRVGTALLFLLMVTTAWAQSTIPGTFNTQSVQPGAVLAGPILTPPIVSFGSGLSAPTVINGQAAVLPGVPPGSIATPPMINAGYVNGSAGYVPMPTAAMLPISATAEMVAQGPRQPARFDFIIAQSNGNLGSGETPVGQVGDPNLGRIAASLRKGPPPTQRRYTNDDIARISGASNNQMPGASTQQPTYPQQQAQPQQQPHSSIGSTPLPTGAKPSPFAPRPVPQNPTPSTTASEPN